MLDEYDNKTLPLLGPVNLAFVGQVIANQTKHIAIVAKRSKNDVHILMLARKKLSLIKLSNSVLASQWKEIDYPFNQALAKFSTMGESRGVSKAAGVALSRLQIKGAERKQYGLF